MSDDAYLKMLNSNNNFSSGTASTATHKSGQKSGVESLGADSKTQWVASILKTPEVSSSEETNPNSMVSTQLKSDILKASKGLTFYSEADFAFEFFQFKISSAELPNDSKFLEVLKSMSSELPSNTTVSQISVKSFFQKTEDSDSAAENTFETFQASWDKIKTQNYFQETVYHVKDKNSSYNYYFLTMFDPKSSALFGLVTAEVQT